MSPWDFFGYTVIYTANAVGEDSIFPPVTQSKRMTMLRREDDILPYKPLTDKVEYTKVCGYDFVLLPISSDMVTNSNPRSRSLGIMIFSASGVGDLPLI